jgi:predicted CopG family antitoxin
VYVQMATKTITITVDAYEALRRQKQPGESFSDVIRRKFGGGSIRGLAGLLTPEEGAQAERGLAERRKQRARRAARRARGRL